MEVSIPPPAPIAMASLLHLSSHPLTFSDFASPSPDTSLPPTPVSPYQRHFPQVEATTSDLAGESCAPIGIWLSALSRERSGPEWHTALLDSTTSPLIHG